MRKRMFFAIVLSLCVADFGAFGAVAQRGSRGGPNTAAAATNTEQPSMKARAGARQKVVGNNVAGGVSARAGKKQTVVNSGAKTSGGSAPANTGKSTAARAGATQKVINTGTKVATAKENTAVPDECQDAFYGCMDSFCMLDNASGGRCICNDRITELDKVLEEILKLDEKSYIMATEGVERIQMGEAEDQIMARVEAAAEKSSADKKEKKQENALQSRKLDLSIFNNSIFSDDDLEDLFSTESSDNSEINSIMNKKGTDLYKDSAKLCLPTISDKCKPYTTMMQTIYAQKIKSDCLAYENSLKAQKNQSQQKLQTAQKALRDAALDEYKNQNKYGTTGECAIAFAQCMQTTAECGTDYTGCVTLAAQENVTNTANGSKAKQVTIKGAVSGADITLAASTMNQLLSKKVMCESVTKQCVNSNKNDAVWNAFLRNAAPALKSAELIAEQNLRSQCIPNAVDCFKNACKSQFGDGDSYDMCLSNPETYKSLCKVQLEPCLAATGGSFEDPTTSTLWGGLTAALSALKVDACTTEVKSCLTERCGADFSGCIGLNTDTIGTLCPSQKLTACMDKYDVNTVANYVAEIAQGLAVQIDNALATACENAANEAMIKVCGDTETCQGLNLDLSTLKSLIGVKACKVDGNDEFAKCLDNPEMFDDNEIFPFTYEIQYEDSDTKNKIIGVKRIRRTDTTGDGVYAKLVNMPDISNIKFETVSSGSSSNTYKFLDGADYNTLSSTGYNINSGNELIKILNNTLDRTMNQIESDSKVKYCMTGRTVQGFDSTAMIGANSNQTPRFPNLTDNIRNTIANEIIEKVYNESLEQDLQQQVTGMSEKISEAMQKVVKQEGQQAETVIDSYNYTLCTGSTYTQKDRRWITGGNAGRSARRGTRELTDKIGTYDPQTNVCTVKTIKYKCTDWKKVVFAQNYCAQFDDGTVLDTQNIQLFQFQ